MPSGQFLSTPPRGGRPAPSPPSANSCKSFLSTPSARRRPAGVRRAVVADVISIRALREEATDLKHKYNQKLIISIHALREEGDGAPHPAGARTQHFYPRPPRGGDPPVRRCRSSRCRHFYPRPPRGGRRSSSKGNGKACKFLSTPSARRATVRQSRLSGSHQISIHASARRATHRRDQ